MAAPDQQKEMNYYQTLGLKREELKKQSEQEIDQAVTQAYRRLMLRWHPNRNPGIDTTKDSQRLSEAYEVLKNPARRRAYDQTLDNQVTHTFSPDFGIEKGPKMYRALRPLEEIQNAFNDFVKKQIGEAKAQEMGYASEIVTDPRTGQQVLRVMFPNQEAANQFIQLMIAQGMIQAPERDLNNQPHPEALEDNSNDHYRRPSPFNTGIPRLTRC